MNPCTCGALFCDSDDRCLRCKKLIDSKRAEKLTYHRQIIDIKPCRCPEETRFESGIRSTLVAELELCNNCDLRVGGPEIEEPGVVKAREDAFRKEGEAEALQNYESFGRAWAGGVGYSVIGTYVLMEFEVNFRNANASEIHIRQSVEDYII